MMKAFINIFDWPVESSQLMICSNYAILVPMLLSEFKNQFNKNSSHIHFNNSGMAPVPAVYVDKAREWFDRFHTEAAFCAPEGWATVEVTRRDLAAFTGCKIQELAFFQTTASALSQAALSIPLKAGDEILTWDQEYPSNFYPWRIAAEKSGAHLIQVPSAGYLTPVQSLLDRVNDKTKIIAVSWVQYQAGAVTDLKQLSDALKGRDIWLVADLIQGIGVRPFNFQESGFDIVCSGSHKWMCSGFGAAFMCIKAERMEQMAPLEYGAMTYGTPETPKSFSSSTVKSAQRYEPGSKAMVEIIAMSETLKLFTSVGIQNIFNESCRLTNKFRSGLSDLSYETFDPQDGPIINFSGGSEKKNSALAAALKEAKISYALRGPGIRLSLHGFNHDHEVEKALNIINGVK